MPIPTCLAELRDTTQALLLLECNILFLFKVYDYMLYIFIAKRVSLCAFGVGKCVYIHRLFMVKINIIRQFVQSCFIVYYHMLVLFWESVEHQNTGYTQKNGAVSIVFTIATAPLFCVYPVYMPHSFLFNHIHRCLHIRCL